MNISQLCSPMSALGSSTVISSSPPVTGERKLFSNVIRLGFAAGHDSPSLKIEEGNIVHNNGVATDFTCVAGNALMLIFYVVCPA